MSTMAVLGDHPTEVKHEGNSWVEAATADATNRSSSNDNNKSDGQPIVLVASFTHSDIEHCEDKNACEHPLSEKHWEHGAIGSSLHSSMVGSEIFHDLWLMLDNEANIE